MKTKTNENTFDTVKFFRKEKERIAKDIQRMSFGELKAYLAEKNEWVKEK